MDSQENPEEVDDYGRNALHIACIDAGRIANAISRYKVNIASFETCWPSEKRKDEIRKELEQLQQEEQACHQTIKALLNSGRIDTDDTDCYGATPLSIAIECGDKFAGALLVGEDPETNPLAAQAGGMNLFEALWWADMEAINALLQSGVELQTLCEQKNRSRFYGKSPFACALQEGNLVAARMMLEAGADPNYKNTKEQTAFTSWIESRRNGQEDDNLFMLRLMSRCGWNPEGAVDKEGNSALSLACRYSHDDLGCTAIHYLVDIGADVNSRNLQGQTPAMNLYGGCYYKEIMSPFVKIIPQGHPYGGRCCNEKDAVLLELLLKAGADVRATDKAGNTLLHYIVTSASGYAGKKAINLCFRSGKPDVTAVNNEGKTAVDMAVEREDEMLIKLLLNNL